MKAGWGGGWVAAMTAFGASSVFGQVFKAIHPSKWGQALLWSGMKIVKIIAIGVMVLIVIVALAGVYKFNYLAGRPGYDVEGNKLEVAE